MDLIGDIINELVNADQSITGPLLKTKVLASRISNRELLSWVSRELDGYKKVSDLPEYRVSTGSLMGSYRNGPQLYTNCQIPVGTISSELYKSITAIEILDSISSIEKLSKSNPVYTIGDDAKKYLEHSIRSMGNKFYEILTVHLTISSTLFSNILSSVRSRLLDFMLEVEKQFGQETEIKDLTKHPEIITTIMNTTINNNGDANVINTGNKANVTTNNSVNKGNQDLLAETLRSNGVANEDIQELLAVVDEEEPKEVNKFSSAVSKWFTKMVGKALDGSWQIAVGTASGLLADALGVHYGWK
jgi:hypothetical protein